MSYAIAPTFEGNRLGVRRLRTLSGAGHMLSGLGDAAGTASVLISQGWDPGIINTLVAMGASDQQLTDLLNGATDITALMSDLTGPAPVPNPITGGSVVPIAPAPSSSAAPQVPAGSTFLYSVGWSAAYGNLTMSTTNVIGQMGSLLSQHGISVISSSVTSSWGSLSYGITLTIKNSVAYAQLSDLQSILTSLMVSLVGNNLTGQNLSLVASPGQALPIPSITNPISSGWLASNWPYLAAGAGAIALVAILGSRR